MGCLFLGINRKFLATIIRGNKMFEGDNRLFLDQVIFAISTDELSRPFSSPSTAFFNLTSYGHKPGMNLSLNYITAHSRISSHNLFYFGYI